ncbi:hypothetical protein V1517DRAFT_326108 [Lipomyces orientalis]|uniref:Uncharacterized protein n=1 Tax=Lipomyces orientalis TaxID=1233043 RepID=A0ACC3TL80_9ASCO
MVLMADDSLPDYKALWKQAEEAQRHTKASLTKRTERLGPQRLQNWADCLHSQQQLYNSVRKFLHASEDDAPRLFSSVHTLKSLRRIACSQPHEVKRFGVL